MMKPNNKHPTFETVLVLIAIGCWNTPSVVFASEQTQASQDSKREAEMNAQIISELKEFKSKNAALFEDLPRITNKSHSAQLFKDADRLHYEANADFAKNQLEEAEEKLKTSLSMVEYPYVRRDLAIVLIEEGKYLEALPSCVDIALEEHINTQTLSTDLGSIEYQTMPHMLLAYALAKTGEFEKAALAYNFVRKKLEREYDRDFKNEPNFKKSDFIALRGGFRLPSFPSFADSEKPDVKKLVEDIQILFTIDCAMRYIGNSDIAGPTINTYRLSKKMIDSAQASNSSSALMAFYKGYTLGRYGYDLTLEQQVELSNSVQTWFEKAARLAGPTTPLGKLALEHEVRAKKGQEGIKKLILDIKDEPSSIVPPPL